MHLPIYLNMRLKTCLLFKTLNDQYIKTLLILHLLKVKTQKYPPEMIKNYPRAKMNVRFAKPSEETRNEGHYLSMIS